MSIASIIGLGAFAIAGVVLAYLFVRWLDRVLPMDEEE